MQIYADNAATTKMSKKAIDAMLPYMDMIYGNPSSIHSFGQKAGEAIWDARTRIARIIGCKPAEITFTSGGTEADNQAILSAAEAGRKAGKKHIVSTAFEHHAVLHTLRRLEKEGFEVTLLDVHEDGIILPEQVEEAIGHDTCLVTVMFANNEIGTIQPIEEIGRICREKGVLFHTDAVQAAGYVDIDVKKQNIDMMSLSAHKFHGPKGIGVLYAQKGILLSNVLEGGAQERGRRPGTENVPAIMGMAAALEESCEKIDEKASRLAGFRDKIITEIKSIPQSVLNGHETKRLPGNINFSFEGIEAESLLLLLNHKGIFASSGSACTSGALEPSHVLLAIGRDERLARGGLRLTLSDEITDEEIKYIIKAVKDVVGYLRGVSHP